jgi:transposase-like protein
MKKYDAAQRISHQKKLLLITKAVNGTPISSICQKENISRTIFYRWIKQYNNEKNIDSPRIERTRKKRCPRTIDAHIERSVVNYAIKHPKETLRHYAQYAGISSKAVWKILQEKELSSRQQREHYFLSNGCRIYPSTSHMAKVTLVKRHESGEKISRICKEIGISRTIFYKWLRQYQQAGAVYEALQSNRPKRERHYRYNKDMEESVLTLVRNHPAYSLSEILACLTTEKKVPASRSGVYKVLKRFSLTTKQERIDYANQEQATEKQYAVTEEMLPPIPDYSFISYLSPPFQDLFFLLHILFFELLHEFVQPSFDCAICSMMSLPESLNVSEKETCAEEVVDDE